jgi:hypothetical protein
MSNQSTETKRFYNASGDLLSNDVLHVFYDDLLNEIYDDWDAADALLRKSPTAYSVGFNVWLSVQITNGDIVLR